MRSLFVLLLCLMVVTPLFAQDGGPPPLAGENVAPVQTHFTISLKIPDNLIAEAAADMELGIEETREVITNDFSNNARILLFSRGATWRVQQDSLLATGSEDARDAVVNFYSQFGLEASVASAEPGRSCGNELEVYITDGMDDAEQAYLGLTGARARELAIKTNVRLRISSIDGTPLIGTADVRRDRMNLTVENGRVIHAKRG